MVSDIPTILLTGGTGYIGCFATVAFLEAGYKVIIVDNLFNSSEKVLDRIELICNKRPVFCNIDITDEHALDGVFAAHPDIESVAHFAGLKSKDPLGFYNVNIQGTLVLLRCMTKHNVRTLMFSSSATVYGDVTEKKMLPVAEACPLAPVNTYGHTKVMGEKIIQDVFDAKNREEQAAGSEKCWNAGILRYSNPCGAHPSGVLGEDLRGGLHLIPVLAQVALGKIPSLGIWGDDYDTPDGTMVRDYIHVSDLARGHIAALKYLQSVNPGVRTWNLGSGRGVSVLDALKAFGRVVGRDLPSSVSARRPEYVAEFTSNSSRAERELKWKAVQTLDDCCADFWRWTTNNPEGYMQKAPEDLVKAMRQSI